MIYELKSKVKYCIGLIRFVVVVCLLLYVGLLNYKFNCKIWARVKPSYLEDEKYEKTPAMILARHRHTTKIVNQRNGNA
jgi:hypothetical protein